MPYSIRSHDALIIYEHMQCYVIYVVACSLLVLLGAGAVQDGGEVVHAQVQATALGTDGGQPAGGAGRHGAAVGALPADDGQRVPVGPHAQRPAQRPGDGGAHEAHTQPKTAQVDVPAADQGDARVHGHGPGETKPRDGGCWRRSVVRHQAAVVVVQGGRRGRSAPLRRRRQQPIVRVRKLAKTVVVLLYGRQKEQEERRQEEQKKVYGQLFLQLSNLLFGRVFRLNAAALFLPLPTSTSPSLVHTHTHLIRAQT